MADRIQLRRGTDSEWNANLSEVLSDGEIGIVRYSEGSILILGDGISTVNDLIGGSIIYQIPVFGSNSQIYTEYGDSEYEQKFINFEITNDNFHLQSISSQNIYENLLDAYRQVENEISAYVEDDDGTYYTSSKIYSSAYIDENNQSASAFLQVEGENSEGSYYMAIQVDLGSGLTVSDTLFARGLGDDDDFSANKTELSYINKAWLRSISGYNASASQNLTHDSSGNFLWINV